MGLSPCRGLSPWGGSNLGIPPPREPLTWEPSHLRASYLGALPLGPTLALNLNSFVPVGRVLCRLSSGSCPFDFVMKIHPESVLRGQVSP